MCAAASSIEGKRVYAHSEAQLRRTRAQGQNTGSHYAQTALSQSAHNATAAGCSTAQHSTQHIAQWILCPMQHVQHTPNAACTMPINLACSVKPAKHSRTISLCIATQSPVSVYAGSNFTMGYKITVRKTNENQYIVPLCYACMLLWCPEAVVQVLAYCTLYK